MLYVSRYIGQEQYGIVDTDDNVEEMADYFKICHLCQRVGLKIAGVDFDYFKRSAGKIHVYQPKSTVTPLQVKTKTLKHIVVTVYKNIITSVTWNIEDITKPVSLRLSDFGTYCADFLLDAVVKTLAQGIINADKYKPNQKVTIILDNKLEYSAGAFGSYGYDFSVLDRINVVFDLRELDDERATRVYDMLFENSEVVTFKNIVDNDERVVKMRGIHYARAMKRLEQALKEDMEDD